MSYENVDIVLKLTKEEQELLKKSLEDTIQTYRKLLQSDIIGREMPKALGTSTDKLAKNLQTQYEKLLAKIKQS
jgi:hypothetical protein